MKHEDMEKDEFFSASKKNKNKNGIAKERVFVLCVTCYVPVDWFGHQAKFCRLWGFGTKVLRIRPLNYLSPRYFCIEF